MAHRPRHRLPLAVAGATVLLVAAPVAGLLSLAMAGSGELWPHLARYVLPDALRQTAILLLGTAAGTVLAGATTAWLVTGFSFPGRRWLEWASLLPLAIPTYITAYAYLDVLHPVGPVQSGLRILLGIAEIGGLSLPDVRSMAGCILVMSASLYPYVYVSTRAALLSPYLEVIEAARGLGAEGPVLVRRVTLPLALPAVCAGLGLALLETLADIGASEFLGVRTLTVAVYVTWTTRGSIEGAAQIALAMLAVSFTLLALERFATQRGDRRAEGGRGPIRPRLTGVRAGLATAACAVPLAIGFAIPVLHLAVNAAIRLAEFGLPAALGSWMWNSARLAAAATALTLLCGFAVAFCHRHVASALSLVLLRVSVLGYAMPGTVLAVGLMGPVGRLDDALAALLAWAAAPTALPALSGSLALLVLAYLVRFLAIPVGMLETGFGRIPAGIDDSARGLGASEATLARRIHVPLLAPSLSGGALLVLVEVMKELPLTLALRPLNVDTLATAIYAEASRGTYEEGALAALAIVALGLLPVIVLVRRVRHAEAAPPRRNAAPALARA